MDQTYELAMPPPCVLIIEDEKDILDILKDILELEGYNVFGVSNGRAALDCLDRIPTPDMILLDLLMPVMNGVEFRNEQLKNPRLANIPVLVMSADKSPPAQFKESNLKYLKKPLDLNELVETMAHQLRTTG